MQDNFRFIDLFAGIGGFHIALENLGGKCVFASEWDQAAKDVYHRNFGILPSGDITKIQEQDIPQHDVLSAGFPCQAFSISGKQKGFNDTRGTLFFDVARIVRHHKPSVVLLENVKNFGRHDNGRTLEVVLNTLQELGYETHSKILKSSHFGVPQARERIYIVALKKSLKLKSEFTFPTGSFNSFNNTIVKDILDEVSSPDLHINRDDIKFYKHELDVKDLSSPLQIGKLNKGGQGERIYSIYSSGITLSAYGGGAAAKTGAYLVDGIVRKLSPRECLKMQGFPKDFDLANVTRNTAYRLLGNSVSVPVVRAVMKSVLLTV